jgi:hypothetical protein
VIGNKYNHLVIIVHIHYAAIYEIHITLISLAPFILSKIVECDFVYLTSAMKERL